MVFEVFWRKCEKMTRARGPKIGFRKTFPPSTILARPLFSGLAWWCVKRAWVYVPAERKVKNYSFREFSGAKTPPGSPVVLKTPARSSYLNYRNFINTIIIAKKQGETHGHPEKKVRPTATRKKGVRPMTTAPNC